MAKTSRHADATASAWPNGSFFPGVPFFGGSAAPGAMMPIVAMAWSNFNAMCAGLQAARHLMDASRETIRKQQDMAMETWRAQLETLAGATAPASDGQVPAFFNPMSTAANAFKQMSGATLQAQRAAFDAFMGAPKPH